VLNQLKTLNNELTISSATATMTINSDCYAWIIVLFENCKSWYFEGTTKKERKNSLKIL